MTAAFLSFVRHYGVFSELEPKLCAAFESATLIARQAPQQLRDAKQFEEAICDNRCWNRAAWSVWGGEYGGPERGGLEREVLQWGTEIGPTKGEDDDGGWVVNTGTCGPGRGCDCQSDLTCSGGYSSSSSDCGTG